MKRRGMTLIELCVAVALTGILLSLTLMSLRQPINKAGPKVVAEQTAEFLRRARNRAQTENCPVAVVFSTNSGAAMCCQSVAEISGELHPRVHRLKDFSAENPDTVLFVGKYGASGTWSKDPPLAGASGSFVDDIVGLPGTARIIEWVAGETNPMLIFLPDGTASSNDLPHLDGAFRIVVSQGVSASASSVGGTGSLPNPPVANLLSEVCNPYTVSVEATGDVRVETGLIQGDGSTAVATSPLPLDNVAPPMLVDPRTSVAPEITDVRIDPNAGYLQGAFGIEQVVSATRQLTVRVIAKQTNDEELYCQVEEATGQGRFSSPGPKRMRYQPSCPPYYDACWIGTWQWAPPPGVVPGATIFTLNATVTAARGGSDTTAGDATFSRDIACLDLGRIFFGAKNTLTNRDEIYCVRGDGTDLNRVTTQERLETVQNSPAASRDGNKLLYVSIDTDTLIASVFGQSRRGGVATKITDGAVNPSLSDDGAVTIYQEFTDFGTLPSLKTVNPDIQDWPPHTHQVFNPDPSLPINNSSAGLRSGTVSEPMPFGPGGTPPDFVADPDNRRVKLPRRIAFEANLGLSNSGNTAIYTADFHDPGRSIEPHNVIRQTRGRPPGTSMADPGGDLRPIWHPDGTKILFWSNRGGKYGAYVVPFNDDIGAEVSESNDGAIWLTPTFNNARDPSYSPDGTKVVFTSDDHDVGNSYDLYIMDLDPATNYLRPLGEPYRVHLGDYALFTRLFEKINRPVWTL